MFLPHSFVLQFLLKGFVDDGNPTPASTLLECSVMCLDTAGCSSYFYNQNRKLCKLAATRYFSLEGLTSVPGYKYYMMRPDCDPDWHVISNQCYLYRSNKKNFFNARNSCRSIGAYLARTYTLWDDTIIRSILKDNIIHGGNLWIGGTDEAVEGRWVWGNGQPITLSLWAKGQPDSGNGENCLEQWGSAWNDGGCLHSMPYLCQK